MKETKEKTRSAFHSSDNEFYKCEEAIFGFMTECFWEEGDEFMWF